MNKYQTQAHQKFVAVIDARVCGIPCKLGIEHYNKVNGRDTWDSDMDYYGYTEMEWELLDRNYRPANWLVNKMTKADHAEAEDLIDDFFHNQKRRRM
jgi:hypothetical protein